MRKAALLTMLCVVVDGSLSWASSVGVDFVVDSEVVVYGGSAYSHRSQNPEHSRMLYAEQLGTNVRTVLYRGEGVLSGIRVAPQGDLVGVLERLWEDNVSEDRATYVDRRVDESGRVVETYYAEEARLLILNLDGEILATVEDVRRYAWESNGDRIAYITGSYSEGGFGFQTTGTWMYDVRSRDVERIHSGGWDVQWASWDGNIYIYDPFDEDAPDTHVFRFQPGTGQLVLTSHRGIYFSPEGSYYYAMGYQGAPLGVFRTEDDEEISVGSLIDSTDRSQRAGTARGWFDEDTLIIASPNPHENGDYLYDVNTAITRQATGTVIPVKIRNNRALVLEGTSVIERTIDGFEVIR